MTQPAEAEEVRVFVYGTLRGGGPAAGLLRGCRPLGQRTVQGTLYDVGGRFPALVRNGRGTVRGELWACPGGLLARLDRYEGVAEGLFVREFVDVDGEPCWTYVAGPRLAGALRPGAEVPEGWWPAAGKEPGS